MICDKNICRDCIYQKDENCRKLEKIIEQVCKETAKEILQILYDEALQYGKTTDGIRYMANKYGVKLEGQMKHCIDETEKYLRGKFSKYTKDEIINAIIRKFDYTAIDRLVDVCWQVRTMKEMEEQSRREDRQTSELADCINEYNRLVEEAKGKGLMNMPTEKIERMSVLIKN